jgi:hypothetical protein
MWLDITFLDPIINYPEKNLMASREKIVLII